MFKVSWRPFCFIGFFLLAISLSEYTCPSWGQGQVVGGNEPLMPGSIYGRKGLVRELLVREKGGTRESEAAITAGLDWLIRIQDPQGYWKLDGNFPDKGQANDVAATSLALLPLLGVGKTHQADKDNQDKAVAKGLKFLLEKQHGQRGDFGGGMYAHGLATQALCEAYGLTFDPKLKKPAQQAVNYIVEAQHDVGGWRYLPKQAGDTSVSHWQIQALLTAKMAGLEVPQLTLGKATTFLESCCDRESQGYGYVGPNATPTMTAAALHCRQYLDKWDSHNPRLCKALENYLANNPPNKMKNIFYHYFTTQVMYQVGGEAWKEWFPQMRDHLVATQEKGKGPDAGSWSSKDEPFSASGGRLLQTSFSLLILESCYRHLPLFDFELLEKTRRR